jgi:hypothetical protein
MADKLRFMDDVHGANRVTAYQVIQDLVEAWTPERKAEMIRSMASRDADLVEHAVIGDYDLTLWFYRRFELYAASLNSGQEDPLSLDGQAKNPKPQALKWISVVSRLQDWVKTYGRILVGSTDSAKTEQYRRLLARHFLIAEWSDHPGAGFFILPDERTDE